MIFVKNLNVFLFFRQKTWKKYLLMFYIGRKAFKVTKISTFKNRIFGIFPKWLSHNFCQKFLFFSLFVSGQNKPRKCVCYCSRLIEKLSRL